MPPELILFLVGSSGTSVLVCEDRKSSCENKGNRMLVCNVKRLLYRKLCFWQHSAAFATSSRDRNSKNSAVEKRTHQNADQSAMFTANYRTDQTDCYTHLAIRKKAYWLLRWRISFRSRKQRVKWKRASCAHPHFPVRLATPSSWTTGARHMPHGGIYTHGSRQRTLDVL